MSHLASDPSGLWLTIHVPTSRPADLRIVCYACALVRGRHSASIDEVG